MSRVLQIEPLPMPLRVDADGVVRVEGTRVTLDTVVEAFQEGMTAEEIILSFPSLGLANVYLAIGYYLHRREAVDAYLMEQDRRRAEVRRQIEARQDLVGIRERLLARREAVGPRE